MKKPRCGVHRGFRTGLEMEQGVALLQLPIDDVWRVCPFPHSFWPRGRVAAHSLLQTSSYPIRIIPKLFPLVKQREFFLKLVQVLVPNSIKCHNGIFVGRIIRIES